MNECAFSIPQDILVGRGTAERLAEAAKKTGGTHAFIISGPHLTKMGHVKHCADLLAAAGIPADIFSGTEGNPSVETVARPPLPTGRAALTSSSPSAAARRWTSRRP